MAVELESAARLAALRDKANATTGETADTLAGAVDTLIAGYGQGGGDSVNPLNYATFIDNRMFWAATFPENTRLEIVVNGYQNMTINMTQQFGYTKNLVYLKLDLSNVIADCNFNQTCISSYQLKELEIVGNTACVTNWGDTFDNCSALETIRGTLDLSRDTGGGVTFDVCRRLQNVRFAEKSITKSQTFRFSSLLTDESIQSIIDGLADLTGGTAQTLTLEGTVGAKLTDEQKAAISAKNWTLTY